MAVLWQISKHANIALDRRFKDIRDIPYTWSYVIRKRILIDNLSELPKEKRPPYKIIFDGTSKELDDWIEGALHGKNSNEFIIDIDEVE